LFEPKDHVILAPCLSSIGILKQRQDYGARFCNTSTGTNWRRLQGPLIQLLLLDSAYQPNMAIRETVMHALLVNRRFIYALPDSAQNLSEGLFAVDDGQCTWIPDR